MKWLLMVVLGLSFVFASVSNARVNPFKKLKNYDFGSDIVWYEANDAAMKSGSVRDGENINYYHLNINKQRILLRLGQNDPSGGLTNTRRLSNMQITDVKVDGRRLPVFDWCLEHQHNPSRKLMQNSVVVNDVCINAGGGGDFVIKVDEKTRNILKAASEIEFIIEPYGRAVKLTFSLQGYVPVITKINNLRAKSKFDILAKQQQDAPVIIESKKLDQVIVAAPKSLSVPQRTVEAAPKSKKASKTTVSKKKTKVTEAKKPKLKTVATSKAKVKSKPKPVVAVASKPSKTCYAKAPMDFRSIIPDLKYPCDDAKKKEQAQNNIMGSVKYEKRKIAKALKAAKSGIDSRHNANLNTKRSVEWEAKQTALWVARCQRHWERKRSPCYCEKYLKHAPPGTKNTCL